MMRGTYVHTPGHGPTGMIESSEPDAEGYVMVYFGVHDGKPVRSSFLADLLTPLSLEEMPLNARIDGEIPSEELQ